MFDFNEESLDEAAKLFRENVKEKGKHLKRSQSAYDKLSDAEKIFINFYLNDGTMSFGSAVVKSGLAKSNEDAINVALALSKNPRVIEALKEIEELGGITPGLIKKGVMDLIKESKDANFKLRAYQTLGKWIGLENQVIRQETISVQLNADEIKDRINNKLADALEESKNIVAALQKRDEPPTAEADYNIDE